MFVAWDEYVWCAINTSTHCMRVCPLGCRIMEQKVDQMSVELSRKQQERENSAQQIKRCLVG